MELVWERLDSKTMTYGPWDDVKTTVKAQIFGMMVLLSKDRVVNYKSDLYHDALWINEKVTGPQQFDWVARESGTFIGESAKQIVLKDWPDAKKYRFEIYNDDKTRWMLDIYEAVELNQVPDTESLCPNCNVRLGYLREGRCQHCAWDMSVNVPDSVNHESLPIEQCELATQVGGCIYHPAPYLYNCTGYVIEGGKVMHDGDTCPQHENDGSYGEYVVFPTLRNVSQTRKVKFNMDDILRELREKLDEANSARDEAYDVKSSVDEAIEDLDNYIDSVDDLISNLENLPEVSVDLDLRVSFES